MSSLFEELSSQSKYSEYKRRINPELVLEYYGARNCFEITREDGQREVQHSCLIDQVIPHHTNGDENPSARMNIDKKLYVCYAFGGGDIFWFIKTMEQKDSFREILPVIGRFLEGSTESQEDFLEELEGYFKSEEVIPEPIPVYSERVLDNWRFTHPYLLEERGVTHEAAKELQVGFDIEENRLVFPHFFEGKLVGWQKRAIPQGFRYPATEPDRFGRLPKYKNTSGFPKSSTLYNYDQQSGEVIVVESPMSVLKARSLATSGDDILSKVVATFGAKVSREQIDLLKKFDRVHIFMDDDEAGESASKKLLRGLYRFTDCLYVEPEKGKDLADYSSREEVLSVIDRGEPAFLQLARWDR